MIGSKAGLLRSLIRIATKRQEGSCLISATSLTCPTDPDRHALINAFTRTVTVRAHSYVPFRVATLRPASGPGTRVPAHLDTFSAQTSRGVILLSACATGAYYTYADYPS